MPRREMRVVASPFHTLAAAPTPCSSDLAPSPFDCADILQHGCHGAGNGEEDASGVAGEMPNTAVGVGT